MKRILAAAPSLAAFSILLASNAVFAHCQVPCGIYDDPARVAMLREDAATIAKAITNLQELAGKPDAQSWNQAIRWTAVKEEHASHVIATVSEYFLTQKVKPLAAGAEGYDAYVQSLAELHALMAAAMKAKQSAASETVPALNAAIDVVAKRWSSK